MPRSICPRTPKLKVVDLRVKVRVGVGVGVRVALQPLTKVRLALRCTRAICMLSGACKLAQMAD